jgi:hypothetical protein
MVTARKVIPIVPHIDAWSYSRWQDYLKCPAFAKYKHFDKIREPGNKAMDRGTAIHKLAEKFARAKANVKLPVELECFEEEFREVQKTKLVLCEQEWAFTNKWDSTDWFSDAAWCRVKVDLVYTQGKILKLRDHKTGKINPAHDGQLSLYALAGLLKYPELDGVEVQNWYLDHGIIMPEKIKIYTHADVPALKKEWAAKVKPLLSDRRFSPKPSSACVYCFFSKGKNGPCIY